LKKNGCFYVSIERAIIKYTELFLSCKKKKKKEIVSDKNSPAHCYMIA
jgi:hypothetical protein